MHMLVLFSVLLATAPAWADTLLPIKSDYEEGYDVSGYRATIAMAGLKAAGFNVGVAPTHFMSPEYAREVEVDALLDEALRNSMDDALRDPFSAVYKNQRMMTNGAEVMVVSCGEVNAKNGFGAYMGYQPFVALFTNPHANPDIASTGFVGNSWITQVCKQMNLH